jgi:hypothetical protein
MRRRDPYQVWSRESFTVGIMFIAVHECTAQPKTQNGNIRTSSTKPPLVERGRLVLRESRGSTREQMSDCRAK